MTTEDEIVAAEKGRIRLILTSPWAVRDPDLAWSLTFETDVTAEEAIQRLQGAHQARVGALFQGAMKKLPNPKIGADAGEPTEQDLRARTRRVLKMVGLLREGA